MQVMKGEKYSKRCDLFSYGTVLWELVSHEVPFEDVREAQLDLMVAIANGKVGLHGNCIIMLSLHYHVVSAEA